VITSNLAPMCEVAGQAACLVDPHSVPAIRKGIARIVADPYYRADLVNRGFENVLRYSAAEIARQFASLYETVAAECAGRSIPAVSSSNGDYAPLRKTL